MKQNLSAREFHALYCPLKNTKSALMFVACFSLVVLAGWRGLHKAPEHHSFVELAFAILVAAVLAKWLVADFECFRERLVLGLAIVSLATGEVSGFLPAIVWPYAQQVRSGELALWSFGLLVSLTMLVQSARNPKVEPTELQKSIIRQLNRNFLITLALAITILVLSPLIIYFLPLRWVQWVARLVSY